MSNFTLTQSIHMHKKVVYIWNRRAPKIAFSPSLFMQPCNSKPHKHLELLFISFCSVSDVEVQWSSSFHPSSSIFEYEYKNPTIHTMDATPREHKKQAQSINAHLQAAAWCICTVSMETASFRCTVNFELLHKIVISSVVTLRAK